jgi:hypothetical protein
MNNARAVATFFVIILVCGLLLYAFKAEGYSKIERINQYVLYEKEVVDCVDAYSNEYTIICENRYLLRSGLNQSGLLEGIESGLVTFEDVKEYIEYLESEQTDN